MAPTAWIGAPAPGPHGTPPAGNEREVPGPPLLHEFASAVAELPEARSRLRQWLERSVDDGPARQDLLLAGTELCTEAVQRWAGGRIALRAWVAGPSVFLEVTGPLGWPSDGSVANLADSGSDARCRLRILEHICDEMSTRDSGRARSVRCRWRTPHRATG